MKYADAARSRPKYSRTCALLLVRPWKATMSGEGVPALALRAWVSRYVRSRPPTERTSEGLRSVFPHPGERLGITRSSSCRTNRAIRSAARSRVMGSHGTYDQLARIFRLSRTSTYGLYHSSPRPSVTAFPYASTAILMASAKMIGCSGRESARDPTLYPLTIPRRLAAHTNGAYHASAGTSAKQFSVTGSAAPLERKTSLRNSARLTVSLGWKSPSGYPPMEPLSFRYVTLSW